MTDALQLAIDQLQKMPPDRQDSLAKLVLLEIEQDRRWTQSTAEHADKLAKLVDQVTAADDRGETEPLDPDQL